MNAIQSRARRCRDAFNRRYVSRGLILIYHRVGDDPVDPWRQCVSESNFATHLETLRRSGFQTVRVSEMIDSFRAGKLKRGTIAVTFDDGYRDNLDLARPILERFDTPATHFATAAYIGSGKPFWWDVIDLVFLRTAQLPEKVTVTLDGQDHRWILGKDAKISKKDTDASRGWKPLKGLQPPSRRHHIHDELWTLLVGSPPDERQRAVQHLIKWAELSPKDWLDMAPMTEDELRALRGDGLVEIGSHSLTHPALSQMTPAMQTYELETSKSRLEQILGSAVRGLSFPQGRSSPEVQQRAREAGYDFACGSVPGSIGWRTNQFHLPRVSVRDWGEARFMSLLRHYFAA